MSVQVGPSPAQLWRAFRAVFAPALRAARYLFNFGLPAVPPAPASKPPWQPGFLDLPYKSPPIAVGLAFHDCWGCTPPGGIVSPEQYERVITSLEQRATGAARIPPAQLGYGSGDWKVSDLGQPQRDYGIWMTEDAGWSWHRRFR